VNSRSDRASLRMIPGALAIAAWVVSSLVSGPSTVASAVESPGALGTQTTSALPSVSQARSDQPIPHPTPVPSDRRTDKRPGPDMNSPVPTTTEQPAPAETHVLEESEDQVPQGRSVQRFSQAAATYTLSGHVELFNAFGPDIALEPGDVTVTLWLSDGSQQMPGSWSTDASGNYVITGVAPGSYWIDFTYVGALSGVRSTLYGTSHMATTIDVQGSQTGLDEVMGEGSTLAGTVTDSGGSPVPDAHVYASLLEYGTDTVFTTFDIVTDAQGHYQLRDAPWGGRWVVQFEKDGYASQSWPGWSYYYYPGILDLSAPPFDFPSDVDATLLHPGSLFGTVTGLGDTAAGEVSSGTVQAEVEVYDFSTDSWVETGDYYPVASDGTYRIDGLYPDTYKIQLSNGDTQLITSSTISVGEDEQHQFDINFADGSFGSLSPSRLLDTRSGVGAPKGAVAPLGVVALQVEGRGGVPASGVSAVVLNVTVAGSTSSGFVTAWAHGATRPLASNLNFLPGQIIPNLVVVPVGDGGKVDLYNGSPGATQLVADVAGYYLPGTPVALGALGSLSPSRLLDTRSGVGAPKGAVAPLGVVALQVAGRGGVPSSGVSAVVLNVTVAGSTSSGFVTAWADGATRPLASNLNFLPGQIIPNLVVVPVGDDGMVDLYNGSPGSTQLIADVAGYYLSGTPGSG